MEAAKDLAMVDEELINISGQIQQLESEKREINSPSSFLSWVYSKFPGAAKV